MKLICYFPGEYGDGDDDNNDNDGGMMTRQSCLNEDGWSNNKGGEQERMVHSLPALSSVR